jgi:IS30 family transposase
MSRGIGVIDVALLGIIGRWHLRDQVSLREIAKRLGILRNTVRRYLRSETTEPAYAERQSASAIDPRFSPRRLAQDRGGQITQATAQPKTASRGSNGIGGQGVL